jgi:hypothetical protein
MKDKRFLLGLIVSACWLAFACYMLQTAQRPVELNAWGDFFAGFFAPLAFLWLVLGYMQQGEELRNSRDALLLQAKELKNSVEQQSELVKVQAELRDQEKERYEVEIRREKEVSLPKIALLHVNRAIGGQTVQQVVRLANFGAIASAVEYKTTGCTSEANGRTPWLEQNHPIDFQLIWGTDKSVEERFALIQVGYVDMHGASHTKTFEATDSLDGRLHLRDVERVAMTSTAGDAEGR